MNKALIGTVLGLALVAGPVGTALAYGGGAKVAADARGGFSLGLGKLFGGHGKGGERGRGFHAMAEVTKITDSTITAEGRDGTTWTIETDADTKFVARGEKNGDVDSIAIGTWIAFKGDVAASDDDGNEKTLDASMVMYSNAKAEKSRKLSGTIESIDADDQTITVETKHRGEVEVEIDGDTVITEDGEAASFSDLVVGATVKVKGMWDAALDVMTAVKVKIIG
jgi:archaellum component FlaF (FlaF/FlaG flagellin family)